MVVCRFLYFLLSVLLITGVVTPARAWTHRGQLQILVHEDDHTNYVGSITLCQVGRPCESDYLLAESFGGGLVREEDVKSQALAVWLAELIDTEGVSRILDADGSAVFTGLPDGLYLITQSEREKMSPAIAPILVTVPYDGSREIGVLAEEGKIVTESPKTGHIFSPLAGAMVIVLSAMGIWACMDILRRK